MSDAAEVMPEPIGAPWYRRILARLDALERRVTVSAMLGVVIAEALLHFLERVM
jgi:hypothetical protein